MCTKRVEVYKSKEVQLREFRLKYDTTGEVDFSLLSDSHSPNPPAKTEHSETSAKSEADDLDENDEDDVPPSPPSSPTPHHRRAVSPPHPSLTDLHQSPRLPPRKVNYDVPPPLPPIPPVDYSFAKESSFEIPDSFPDDRTESIEHARQYCPTLAPPPSYNPIYDDVAKAGTDMFGPRYSDSLKRLRQTQQSFLPHLPQTAELMSSPTPYSPRPQQLRSLPMKLPPVTKSTLPSSAATIVPSEATDGPSFSVHSSSSGVATRVTEIGGPSHLMTPPAVTIVPPVTAPPSVMIPPPVILPIGTPPVVTPPIVTSPIVTPPVTCPITTSPAAPLVITPPVTPSPPRTVVDPATSTPEPEVANPFATGLHVTPPSDPPPASTRNTRKGKPGGRKVVQPAAKQGGHTDEKENRTITSTAGQKRTRGWVWVTESELLESQPPAKVPRTRLRDRNPNLTYKV
jgi:hypothetical protein